MFRHFKSVAESTSLPVFLYNVPGRTGVKISPSTVAKLATIPNIYGMKDVSGDIDNLTAILNAVPETFRVYTGNDNPIVPALSIGVYRLISVVAQIIPAKINAMMKVFGNGELKKASAMHRELFPIFDVIFIASNPVPIKVALTLMGYNVGNVRLPLTMPSKSQVETIAETLYEAKLIESKDVPKNQYI